MSDHHLAAMRVLLEGPTPIKKSSSSENLGWVSMLAQHSLVKLGTIEDCGSLSPFFVFCVLAQHPANRSH
jgi:hypothetical protein